ncbi:hypothetical protein B0I73DRAFT_134396 [Yarrowia lipolytica]|uniref:Uncharacterized protein n=1 Tax=Yarrowia lipolytica TaxID=4952 RepID=A0A371CC84_YARLL|nr:hypothetical protein B0I71DRAFT_128270 [Yarrowia lipolytica]RDW38057.1 hypothetical protein B0I73DRAFT_134396 [Yarrowia lipolytica]RDW47875.1 hypothetical protein B0I74DRAFT_134611 [Yarrowia lipolytica]RDW55018.1 hypothetical protein B0I75DRAFT_133602 [Yarrowia lipolytica]
MSHTMKQMWTRLSVHICFDSSMPFPVALLLVCFKQSFATCLPERLTQWNACVAQEAYGADVAVKQTVERVCI